MSAEITGEGITHIVRDATGYEAIKFQGLIHEFIIMPDGLGTGLMAEVSNGRDDVTALLPADHVEALHTFLGRWLEHNVPDRESDYDRGYLAAQMQFDTGA